tara:strand:+ start:1463 stop:2080 length:618 start_codon:yes stop_codon:yes gene_type:complete
MRESLDTLVRQLKDDEVHAARAKAPEGYEDEYVRAYTISKFLSLGGKVSEINPPTAWRETYLALSIHTELPPKLCAKLSGIRLAWLRLYLGENEDKEVEIATNISRAANFEARIDCPSQRDLRAAAIPLAGLNAMAGWTTSAQDQKSAAELEVSEAIEQRRMLSEQIDELDRRESEMSETLRKVKSSDVVGVLGLGIDIEVDENE